MDIQSQTVGYRISKALRYVQLYGVDRTLVKMRSHSHMRRAYELLPQIAPQFRRAPHVGVIGCGKYAFAVICYFLKKRWGRIIHGAMDININRAASLFQQYKLNYYTDSPNRILEDPQVDLVFVSSNHASHAGYAVRAIRAGKHVHIEKPHVVDRSQLLDLCRAMNDSNRSRVRLGFNRPLSPIARTVLSALKSQSGPASMNWYVTGHSLEEDHWYLNPGEGGRVLGNLCHWIEFVYQAVPPEHRFPIDIFPIPPDLKSKDLSVILRFGDGSVASLVFTEKGASSEGVRERFSASKGQAIVTIDDFKSATVDVGFRKTRISHWHRELGHRELIESSYEMARNPDTLSSPASVAYVWEVGELCLKVRDAIESGIANRMEPFDPSVLRSEKTLGE